MKHRYKQQRPNTGWWQMKVLLRKRKLVCKKVTPMVFCLGESRCNALKKRQEMFIPEKDNTITRVYYASLLDHLNGAILAKHLHMATERNYFFTKIMCLYTCLGLLLQFSITCASKCFHMHYVYWIRIFPVITSS